MLSLKPNYKNIGLRIFSLVIIYTLLQIIKNSIDMQSTVEEPNSLLYIVMGFGVVWYLIILISFLSVLRVDLNTVSGLIVCRRFFQKKSFNLNNVTSYKTTFYKGKKSKSWNGLVLYLHNKKSLRLFDQNLQNISLFKEYLQANKIKYVGELRLPFYYFGK